MALAHTTHARAVTTDLYVEMLHPSDPARYHDGRGWKPLVERVETIRVRGDEDDVLTVRATRHGPLLDALAEPERVPISLAWAGAQPETGSGLDGMLAVARAQDAEDLLEALGRHAEPPLAVVYADRDGAAGHDVPGAARQRESGCLAAGLRPGRCRCAACARWFRQARKSRLRCRRMASRLSA